MRTDCTFSNNIQLDSQKNTEGVDMDVVTGYAGPKRLLKQHFGNDFKIMTAYMEKALNCSVNRHFTVMCYILRNSCNAAQNFQYMLEHDLPSNIKQTSI